MKLLIYYAHGNLNGNYMFTTTAKQLTEKHIEKIKDEVAVNIGDTEFIQSDPNRVIIKNIMKL